jgi:cobalamin 5'-phosphate synthase/cobalamin synthase
MGSVYDQLFPESRRCHRRRSRFLYLFASTDVLDFGVSGHCSLGTGDRAFDWGDAGTGGCWAAVVGNACSDSSGLGGSLGHRGDWRLHLDGAMDAADGLAVPDPVRRLEVMRDSVTGAFGAMAAIAILLLKTAALSDLNNYRWLALMGVAGWGRWAQLVAIARYPYLRAEGKGAFHKESIYSPFDFIPGVLLLLSLSVVQVVLEGDRWLLAAGMALGGSAIGIFAGAWFNHRLGGHTGDTYGAVVEWTEALLLCLLAALEG